MHYFGIFFKKFNKPCVNFLRVWTKNTNSWEIFKKFSKTFLRKQQKTNYFGIFFKKFNKLCVNISHVWTTITNCQVNYEKILKILDENSIEKLTFKLILEMVMLKIEPSEITSFFYNNFFNFGGGTFPVFPLATPLNFNVYFGASLKNLLRLHSPFF